MDLDVALTMVLKSKAIEECFKSEWFDICPINKLHEFYSYPNRKVLLRAHCLHFDQMTDEMIVELKSLAREAIYYEKPWWKIF